MVYVKSKTQYIVPFIAMLGLAFKLLLPSVLGCIAGGLLGEFGLFFHRNAAISSLAMCGQLLKSLVVTGSLLLGGWLNRLFLSASGTEDD
jgi:hypothetical protein